MSTVTGVESRVHGVRSGRPGTDTASTSAAPGVNHEAGGQWVMAGGSAVRGRDLPPAGDAELLAQDVRMSLGRPRRYAEAFADFLVRAACCDQLDDLPLTGRDRRNRALEGLVHSRDATNVSVGFLFTERRIFAVTRCFEPWRRGRSSPRVRAC